MNSFEVQTARDLLDRASEATKSLRLYFMRLAPVDTKIYWFDRSGFKCVVRVGVVESYETAGCVWVRVEPIRTAKCFLITELVASLAAEEDYTRVKDQ